MSREIVLALMVLVLAPPAHASADDCVYDQSEQLKKLQSIAVDKPQSKVFADERKVAWTGRDNTQWSLVYGGCSHLGFTVTSSKVQNAASTQAAVLQAATRMAAEFWDPSDATDLKRAIAQRKFVKRTAPPASYFFSMAHESYDVFEIEHEFKERNERITVRWVRSF